MIVVYREMGFVMSVRFMCVRVACVLWGHSWALLGMERATTRGGERRDSECSMWTARVRAHA